MLVAAKSYGTVDIFKVMLSSLEEQLGISGPVILSLLQERKIWLTLTLFKTTYFPFLKIALLSVT